MPRFQVCSRCGPAGLPKTKVKGSIAIEIILWRCFTVPGLIYSLWRSTSDARVRIARLRSAFPDVRIIVFSARAGDECVYRAIKNGAAAS